MTNAWCRNIKKNITKIQGQGYYSTPSRVYRHLRASPRKKSMCHFSVWTVKHRPRTANVFPLGSCPGLVQPRSTKSTSHGGTKVYLQSFIVAALPSVGLGRYRESTMYRDISATRYDTDTFYATLSLHIYHFFNQMVRSFGYVFKAMTFFRNKRKNNFDKYSLWKN